MQLTFYFSFVGKGEAWLFQEGVSPSPPPVEETMICGTEAEIKESTGKTHQCFVIDYHTPILLLLLK